MCVSSLWGARAGGTRKRLRKKDPGNKTRREKTYGKKTIDRNAHKGGKDSEEPIKNPWEKDSIVKKDKLTAQRFIDLTRFAWPTVGLWGYWHSGGAQKFT